MQLAGRRGAAAGCAGWQTGSLQLLRRIRATEGRDRCRPGTSPTCGRPWRTRSSATAQVQADRRFSSADFERPAARSPPRCWSGGWPGGSRRPVLYSCPEYLEAVFAAFKLGITPVDTNYRYGGGSSTCGATRRGVDRLPRDRHRHDRPVAKSSPGCSTGMWDRRRERHHAPWAVPYEDVVSTHPSARAVRREARSPDDLASAHQRRRPGCRREVMWRQDDLFVVLTRTAAVRYPETVGWPHRHATHETGPGVVPCAPLMPPTSAWSRRVDAVVGRQCRHSAEPQLLGGRAARAA